MSADHTLHLLGFAFGLAGVDLRSGDGPLVLQRSSLMSELKHLGIVVDWEAMIQVAHSSTVLRLDETVRNICLDLARKIVPLAQQRKCFSVIGGDHTSAIGTWSGVYHALHEQGDLGLIWLDAHMDSHTPETTETGRIHGMPLACLLGYGYPTLTGILNDRPKFKPENVCVIGVRSYEAGEAALLNRLNVRVYYMDEINQRGMAAVMNEVMARMHEQTIGYGMSIDLDVIDPVYAPGVDVPEIGGVKPEEFCAALERALADPKLIGTEIVEFDPYRDHEQKTEKIIVRLLEMIARAKRHDHA